MTAPAIRLEVPAREQADALGAALAAFAPRLVEADGSWHVELEPGGEAAQLLLALLDAVGSWLAADRVASCRIGVGAQSFTLLRPSELRATDSAESLLERVLQLQGALDSRVLIEQAKGILAERCGLTLDGAFALLRETARSNRMPIQRLASAVVEGDETPAEIAAALG